MIRMGIRELRDTLTTTIRRVRGGEIVEVTHDGEAVARLVPVSRDRLQLLLASGEATAPQPLDRPLSRLPVTGPQSASEALADDRAER
jgi:antitoxin (DNA-binding transcriptional repressor) of toxin-antitoxin stability system